MTTLANLIDAHNALASHFDDVKPIGKFSGSKAAMQAKIDALRARLDAIRATNDDTFTPADLARELGVNGKVLRAKIRRLRKDAAFPRPVRGNRYANDDKGIIIEAVTN